MIKKSFILVLSVTAIFLYAGCGQKKVNRDYIPIIKENLYKLQVAVKDKNLAQIDSLLSVERNQSSDSLIRFVYGMDDNFNFVQFGNAEITYTNEVARIDCYVMDSSSTSDRPMVFFLEYDHNLWLFTSFAVTNGLDSLQL